jgi:hypothetical protein
LTQAVDSRSAAEILEGLPDREDDVIVRHVEERPDQPALAAFVFAGSELDAWAIVANPRLPPRELDQIHVHSDAGSRLAPSE